MKKLAFLKVNVSFNCGNVVLSGLTMNDQRDLIRMKLRKGDVVQLTFIARKEKV